MSHKFTLGPQPVSYHRPPTDPKPENLWNQLALERDYERAVKSVLRASSKSGSIPHHAQTAQRPASSKSWSRPYHAHTAVKDAPSFRWQGEFDHSNVGMGYPTEDPVPNNLLPGDVEISVGSEASVGLDYAYAAAFLRDKHNPKAEFIRPLRSNFAPLGLDHGVEFFAQFCINHKPLTGQKLKVNLYDSTNQLLAFAVVPMDQLVSSWRHTKLFKLTDAVARNGESVSEMGMLVLRTDRVAPAIPSVGSDLFELDYDEPLRRPRPSRAQNTGAIVMRPGSTSRAGA